MRSIWETISEKNVNEDDVADGDGDDDGDAAYEDWEASTTQSRQKEAKASFPTTLLTSDDDCRNTWWYNLQQYKMFNILDNDTMINKATQYISTMTWSRHGGILSVMEVVICQWQIHTVHYDDDIAHACWTFWDQIQGRWHSGTKVVWLAPIWNGYRASGRADKNNW